MLINRGSCPNTIVSINTKKPPWLIYIYIYIAKVSTKRMPSKYEGSIEKIINSDRKVYKVIDNSIL